MRRLALVALCDFQAQFLVVLSYRFTTLISVSLLSSLSTPAVVLLSVAFLHAAYSKRQYAAICLCVAGMLVLIVSDATRGTPAAAGNDGALDTIVGNGTTLVSSRTVKTFDARSQLKGDVICLAGALLYSVSNVLSESTLKQHPQSNHRFLAWLGTFGAAYSFVQFLLLEAERNAVRNADAQTLGLLCVYCVSASAFYTMVSFFLSSSSAVVFNLSVLTANVWALVAGMTLFGYAPSGWYFLSFIVILSGLVLFHAFPSVANDAEQREEIVSL